MFQLWYVCGLLAFSFTLTTAQTTDDAYTVQGFMHCDRSPFSEFNVSVKLTTTIRCCACPQLRADGSEAKTEEVLAETQTNEKGEFVLESKRPIILPTVNEQLAIDHEIGYTHSCHPAYEGDKVMRTEKTTDLFRAPVEFTIKKGIRLAPT
ncbi:hypothetical protein DdX_18716 [Ditylenchus destructor]|uniref:Uncharacterized protein n=1 Tax=Ditylenchus destructor TaxID=166010 RepID=A0AAD4MLT1_9BILA|nr:hypothetical protein DdX_18716 [Ditylenchus destructor]